MTATIDATAIPRLQAQGLGKKFGATTALVGADLDLRRGEVHTVIGENGSGKSTLVKILSGVHHADSGSLTVDGAAADRLRSPRDARALGVATVFQEVLSIPGRSVVDNIVLGAHGDAARLRARAGELIERLLGTSIDVDSPVDDLSISGRQACCIARSLIREPDVLILDESTSALDVATRDRLFAEIRDVTARGGGVVFISHRMEEVFAIADVVTVLRSGSTVVSRLPVAQTTIAGLVELMSGTGHDQREPRSGGIGAVVLEARDVVVAPDGKPIDLTLHEGEIVGLAGLEGQGQETFLRALCGRAECDARVTRVDGENTRRIATPTDARDNEIAYVPGERRHAALFEQMSTLENFGIASMGRDTVAGLLRPRKTAARLAELGALLRLRSGAFSDPVTTLSGGNQQKVVIARALADRPKILLLNDPTRGIDQSAKHDLYDVLERLCRDGVSIVILSSEVDELVELVDRVVVFRANAISALIERSDLTRTAVVAAYFESTAPVVEPQRQEAI